MNIEIIALVGARACMDAILLGETAGNCAYTLHIDKRASHGSSSSDASKYA